MKLNKKKDVFLLQPRVGDKKGDKKKKNKTKKKEKATKKKTFPHMW